MKRELLIAGFGGQGVLFTGKVIASAGLLAGQEVSWLPSYGPEMRGGTANCSICIDEKPIGCPVVTVPDMLMAMNAPSFMKFVTKVVAGGHIVYDSSFVEKNACLRTDVSYHGLPATLLCVEQGLEGLANLMLLGCASKHLDMLSLEELQEGLKTAIPKSKAHLLTPNLRAFEIGQNFDCESI